jgi:hypothetical protein
MANYPLSALAQKTTPTMSDRLALLDVEDTTTEPAGPDGSDKTVTVENLLAQVPATLTKYIAPAVVTLTYGTSIEVDAAEGNAFNVTLTASTGTIENPTSPVDAQVIRFRITQGSGGSFTVAWGTDYDFGAGGSAPVLSTTAGKLDIVAFEYDAGISKWCCLNSGGIGY